MKTLIGILLVGLFATSNLFAKENSSVPHRPSQKFEKRCGWIVNPTPSNWWLIDRDGQWIIGTQGGEQAEGDLPNFPEGKEAKKYWVETNGYHGYGCACLWVKISGHDIREIRGGNALPLAKCRADKSIGSKEHELRD